MTNCDTDTTEAITLHVGTPEEMGRRFIDAWKRAESGEVFSETHHTFSRVDELLAVLTPERVELLRYVRRKECTSVEDLARALDRDLADIDRDVCALSALGLLTAAADGISAPYGVIEARLII